MKKLLLLSSSTSYSFSGVTAGLVTSDHSELLQHPAKLGLGWAVYGTMETCWNFFFLLATIAIMRYTLITAHHQGVG